MSNKSVVKSPTEVLVEPTFVLAPANERRTCNLSGNELRFTLRVQNLTTSPLLSERCGVTSQLLIVLFPATLLKLTPIHELVGPA